MIYGNREHECIFPSTAEGLVCYVLDMLYLLQRKGCSSRFGDVDEFHNVYTGDAHTVEEILHPWVSQVQLACDRLTTDSRTPCNKYVFVVEYNAEENYIMLLPEIKTCVPKEAYVPGVFASCRVGVVVLPLWRRIFMHNMPGKYRYKIVVASQERMEKGMSAVKMLYESDNKTTRKDILASYETPGFGGRTYYRKR